MVTYVKIPPKKKSKTNKRDRQITRQQFLEALRRLLERDGPSGAGINAIAQEAGKNKVLLYRYFGNLDGLYREFARESKIFPSLEEILGNTMIEVSTTDSLLVVENLVLGFIREIRRHPLALVIMRWEISDQNGLTRAFSSWRSEQTRRIQKILLGNKNLEKFDLDAVMAVLYGGLVYLLLRADSKMEFSGLDLGAEAAWNRIEKAVLSMVHALLKSQRSENEI